MSPFLWLCGVARLFAETDRANHLGRTGWPPLVGAANAGPSGAIEGIHGAKRISASVSRRSGPRSENGLFAIYAVIKTRLRKLGGFRTRGRCAILFAGGPPGMALPGNRLITIGFYDQRVLAGYDAQTGLLHPRVIDENRRALGA